MNKKTCAECGGPLDRGFIVDKGDYDVAVVPFWVEGEPEQARFLGMSAGLKVKGRAAFYVVTYRCRVCGLLKSYAPLDQAK